MDKLLVKDNLKLEELLRMAPDGMGDEIYLLHLDNPDRYVNKIISNKCYDMLLYYYNNNQIYFILNIDAPESYKKLIQLEEWFIKVIEPPPLQSDCKFVNMQDEIISWINREKFKFNGRTCYCNYRLSNIIKLSDSFIPTIKRNIETIIDKYIRRVSSFPGQLPDGIDYNFGLFTRFPIKIIDGYPHFKSDNPYTRCEFWKE